MIWKIFLTTGILFVLYSFCIRFIPQQKMEPQNMWQENMIKMQDFVYENNLAEDIILGSSLSMCIYPISDKYYNLAAGGGDPFTGLEILKRSNKKVKRVFIETNYLLTKTANDDKYLGSLFMPVLYDLRKHFIILREKGQPASLAGHYLQSKIINKIFLERGNEMDNNVVKKRVEIFKRSYSDSVSIKPVAERNLVRLTEYLYYLRNIGAELIFYEMPIDCSLTNDPQPVYYRKTLNAFCKKYGIKQLPLESCSDYQTSDGNHLMGKSADRYKDFFYNEIAKIGGV